MWFVFAAASALCFGLRGILYQWTSRRPINRNLLLFGVYLSGTLIALAVNAAYRQPWTGAVWIGALMGLFSFIANASMYKGYSVGKTSLIAMFTALPPVVVVLLAFGLWGEKLNGWQTAAFLVILAGLMLIRYSNDLSLKNLQGAGWGVLTMLFFGLTDLTSKAATLSGAANLPTLIVMYGAGTALFGASWGMGQVRERRTRALLTASSRETAAAAETRRQGGSGDGNGASQRGGIEIERVFWTPKRTLLWGMAVGISNVCGMMLVLPAFKLGMTGLVSVVIASNVVIVLLYARLVLKEKFSRLETGGLLLALLGIVVIRLAAL
ncbi:DMT family transporter [Paenibacillus filicis]|uniref:DMT family transporter n=1 Tax=Paenibacillus gyeongsangnamensis TaxID=3388067 RepID=A0ABT4QBW5_9BACL|nr:DMT family transporter [Paenibacillus filicis]MCZ8514382.1 DMT family transporter [Paenibacillus filicis]